MNFDMKIEVGKKKPDMLKELWPGQYDFFSHFEYLSGVPHALFMITTRKENGKPNACFHSWSAFSGDSGGFHAILSGLGINTHTYRNIMREKEFCVNFVSSDYYDGCIKTIADNGDEMDEIAAGGFTAEPSKTVKCPRLKEAFLTLECTLHSATDLSGKGIISMVVGQVQLAAVAEGFHEIDRICSKDGFMFNVHSPKSAVTGEGQKSAMAVLKPVKMLDE